MKHSIKLNGLKYGLIFSIFSIIYGLILQFAGVATNKLLNNITFVVLIVIIVLAFREFKSNNYKSINYRQGLGLGTLIGLVGGLISSIFNYIYLKFIDSSLIDEIIGETMQAMSKNPNVLDSEIDLMIKFGSRFFTPLWMSVTVLILYIFFAFIFSLIIAAIMKTPERNC